MLQTKYKMIIERNSFNTKIWQLKVINFCNINVFLILLLTVSILFNKKRKNLKYLLSELVVLKATYSCSATTKQ